MFGAEDEILIACTRRAPDDQHRERVHAACRRGPVDWGGLLSAAIEHQVAPLVYRNLRACDGVGDLIPAAVHDEFGRCTFYNAWKRRLFRSGLATLTDHFAARRHRVMLIKAAALDHVLGGLYELTMASDADAVVRPTPEAEREHDAEETRRAIDAYHRIRQDHLFEVDNRVHHDINMSGVLPIDFGRIWGDAKPLAVGGSEIFIPCVEDLVIISCINVIRKGTIRLRSLFDVAELIDEHPGLDWDRIARRAAGDRCGGIVHSAVRAARSVLGCDPGGASLDALAIGGLRGRAIGCVVRRISPGVVPLPPASNDSSGEPPPRRAPARRSPWSIALRMLSLSPGQIFRWYWYCKLRSSYESTNVPPTSRWKAVVERFVHFHYYEPLTGQVAPRGRAGSQTDSSRGPG